MFNNCLTYLRFLTEFYASLPGDHRELEPPDPISNSAVKWFIADGSVGFPHARVGHCQVSKSKPSHLGRFFYDFLNMLVK